MSEIQCEYPAAMANSQCQEIEDNSNSEILCHLNGQSPLLFSSGLSLENNEQFKIQYKLIEKSVKKSILLHLEIIPSKFFDKNA